MIPEDTPSVIRHGSHTAICLGRKRKFWWLIPMGSRMLRMVKQTDKQMQSMEWQVTTFDVRDTARRYQKHGAGMAPSAKRFIDDLASDTPVQLKLDLENERVLTVDEARTKLKACNDILKGVAA